MLNLFESVLLEQRTFFLYKTEHFVYFYVHQFAENHTKIKNAGISCFHNYKPPCRHIFSYNKWNKQLFIRRFPHCLKYSLKISSKNVDFLLLRN